MERSKLTIGQKVTVTPRHTNLDLSPKPSKKMFVRELKKGNCAGLSFRKNGKSIYGILYEIIS